MKRNQKKVSKKSYLKMIGIMCGGAVLGAGISIMTNMGHTVLREGALRLYSWLGRYCMEMLWVGTVLGVLGSLYSLRKVKALGEEIRKAEDRDEDVDALDYQQERVGGYLTVATNGLMFLTLLLLPIGMEAYIDKEQTGNGLWLLVPFLLNTVVLSFSQVKLVQVIQKQNPRMKGDPANFSFKKDWLDSCDEAEREMIYQASYKANQFTGSFLWVLMLAGVVLHMAWGTGMISVLLLGMVAFAQNVVYQRHAMKLRRQKLNA